MRRLLLVLLAVLLVTTEAETGAPVRSASARGWGAGKAGASAFRKGGGWRPSSAAPQRKGSLWKSGADSAPKRSFWRSDGSASKRTLLGPSTSAQPSRQSFFSPAKRGLLGPPSSVAAPNPSAQRVSPPLVNRLNFPSNRGNGGRGGGLEHARTQAEIKQETRGTEEVPVVLPNGRKRFVDVVSPTGQMHQVGDMRTRGGVLRPSARERGAIEDLRKANPQSDIFFHDKQRLVPSLRNPDLQPGWKPAPPKHRKDPD